MESNGIMGLTEEEARGRLCQYGENVLVPEKKSSAAGRLLGFVKEPMLLLLFAAAGLYFLLGEWADGLIMLVFVAFIAGVNAVQSYRTDRTLRALKDLSAPGVDVIRDGQKRHIRVQDVVPGDIVSLSEGQKIPADGVVRQCHDLGVNESALTGEPATVRKSVQYGNGADGNGSLYAGTLVVQGGAQMEVQRTGRDTELGRIGQTVSEAPDRPTPLEKATARLVRAMALVSIMLFIGVTAATLLRCGDVTRSLLAGVTLMMALIPEEFPVILAVFLAAGAWRLARRNALVRRIPSVETLGCVSVLCVDKTGTMTQNCMKLREILPAAGERQTLRIAAYACELQPFDPMEQEILDAAPERRGRLVHEYDFDPALKLMGHVWRTREGLIVCVKGAPEGVLKLCGGDGDARGSEEMARKGYRVLAVASVRVAEIPDRLSRVKLNWDGLIGFDDPVRPGVAEEIAVCRRAGIRVVMVTGDMAQTAAAYAKALGIGNPGDALTGDDLDGLNDTALQAGIRDVNVFARIRPEQKLRIVRAFKAAGEIVAMTGDGVNDAPALKYADIGIGMGRGTHAAREAADMVLMDDSFATIARTVRDGRRIFDNIRKAFAYVAAVHVPIALIALLAPLLRLPILLYPEHVVLLELIIDPACSIVFERLPEEPDVMSRPPRDVRAPVVTARAMLFALAHGLLMTAAVFIPYLLMQSGAAWQALSPWAGTFAFGTLVFANLFAVYGGSGRRGTIVSIAKNRDPSLWLITAGVLLALALCVYAPFMRPLFNTAPMPLWLFAASLGAGLLPSLIADIIKPLSMKKCGGKGR